MTALATYETNPTGTAVALSVARLAATRFRCYESARLQLDPRPVVLTGPNGAGKTNLLEAVSLLAPGRGLRRATLPEIDRGWLGSVTNAFLIRDPREMLTSLIRVTPEPTLADTGLPQQSELFHLFL